MFNLQPPRHISTLHTRDRQPRRHRVCLLGCCGLDVLTVNWSLHDPTVTSASISYCNSEAGFSPYQSDRLSR